MDAKNVKFDMNGTTKGVRVEDTKMLEPGRGPESSYQTGSTGYQKVMSSKPSMPKLGARGQ
jgi:hypothetical protein